MGLWKSEISRIFTKSDVAGFCAQTALPLNSLATVRRFMNVSGIFVSLSRWRVFAGAVAVLCAMPLLASNVHVRATDAANHPLAGVQVQILSHGKPVQGAVTDSQGHAEFPSLTDGVYDISAAKDGFQTVVQKNIAVHNGSLESIDVELSPQITVKEEVSVAAGVEVPLQESASPKSEISRVGMKETPNRPTTVKDALPLVPGVIQTPDGQTNIAGMSEHHSLMLVNSANVTDPVTGQFGLTLPVDATNSVRVLQTPYEAQYGGFTAGVVSVDTRGGGQKWDFEINDPTPEFRIRSAHIHGLKEFTPRIALNGPVKRDKLFFAESFTYDIEKKASRTLPFPNNETRLQSFNSFTQLDYVISPEHMLTASLHVAPQQQTYAGLDFFNPQAVTPNFDAQQYTATLLDRFTFGSGILQSTLAANKVQAELVPQGSGPMMLSPTGNTGNYFSWQNRNATRVQELENVALNPRSWAGEHNLQFGTEVSFAAATVSVFDNPVVILGRTGQPLRRIDYNNVPATQKDDVNGGVYVQDHWVVASRIAIDAGARLQHETFSDTTYIAPRFGFKVQPFKEHGTVISGGFGVFHDRLPLNIGLFERWPEEVITTYPSAMAPADGPIHYRNRLRARHKHVNIVRFDQNDTGFSPELSAWNVRIEQPISKWMQVDADYSESNSDSLVLLLPEASPDGYALTLRDEGRSNYRQWKVSTRTHWKRLQTDISYVHSRALGDRNEFDFFLGALPVPVVPKNVYGSLPADVPDRVLASGHVDLLKKVWLNPMIEFRSGFSYRGRDVFENFLAAEQRYPSFASVSARIGRRFQATKKYALIVSIAGSNLTNHFNALAVHSNVADPSYGQFFGSYPRRLRLDIDVDF